MPAVAQYRQKEVAQHGSREAFHQAQLREVEQKVALRRTELTFGGPRTKDGSPDKRTKEWKVRLCRSSIVGTRSGLAESGRALLLLNRRGARDTRGRQGATDGSARGKRPGLVQR